MSGSTRVSRYQKGKTKKVKTNLHLLEQEIVSGSGICWAICKSAPHPRQPRQHPTTQFFTGRMPFLAPNQQCQSTEGINKVVETEWKYLDVNDHWQQLNNIMRETAQVTCELSKGPSMQSLENMVVEWGSCWSNKGKKKRCENSKKKKNRQRHGRSTRRVDKMQRGLFLYQRERNRRHVQAI